MIPGIVASSIRSASPVAKGHRHWRLFFPEGSTGANYIQFGRVRFSASLRDEFLTIEPDKATASSASSGLYAPGNVLDPEQAQRGWSSLDGDNVGAWIAFNFSIAVEINRIEIAGAGAQPAPRFPKLVQVQWSDDGENWTNAWAPQTNLRPGATTAWIPYVNPAANGLYDGSEHKHWRLRWTGRQGQYIQMREVQMVRDGANIASGGIATASSVYNATYTADKAFDNNQSTSWSTGAGAAGGNLGYDWLAYEFLSPVRLTAFTMTADRNDYSGSPYMFAEWSDDGINWTPIELFSYNQPIINIVNLTITRK